MNIYSHITFTALIVFLFLGIYVLCIDRKSNLNRMFFVMSIFLTIWSIGSFMLYHANTKETSWMSYRVLLIGQGFYMPVALHYFLVLTQKNIRSKWYTYTLLYLPPSIVLFKFFSDRIIIKDFIILALGHVRIIFDFSFWFYFYLFIQLYCSLAILHLLLDWRKKTVFLIEKKQALVILLTSSLALVFGSTLGIIFPIYNIANTAPLAPVAAIFSAIGIWFAVVKYKLMVLTPSIAAENILDTMVDSVVLVDSELKILTVNDETCKLLGFNDNELIGKELSFLFVQDDMFNKKNFLTLLSNGPVRNHEVKYISKSGRKIPIVLSASEHRNNNGSLLGIVVISRDITERKDAEERLKHLAHHDSLTGLPNRLLFSDRLKQSLATAQRYNTIVAVILLDIDRFKDVNDVLGHNNGDALLIEVANRLGSKIRKADTIARLGGDEFVFVINNLKRAADAEEVASKIHNAFSEKFIIDSNELHITPSIGISLYPFDGDSAETLIKNADMAMYHAKSHGKNTYKAFTPALSTTSTKKLALESSLRKAIEKNEFIVHYQPMVDVNNGGIVNIEALVRWQHPDKGIIPPAKFIPLAEETGLIVQIGEFVLREACRQNKYWIDQGLSSVPVSVNLSACQFRNGDLIETVLKILKETGLEPNYLELEITESTAMYDIEKTATILNTLFEYGIKFSIDDFGVGYSSLNYLKKFPIHTIKIDRFFIQNITSNPNDAAIVTAIFAMAHTMNLKVIAEGVETLEQVEFLRSLKWKFIGSLVCDGAQGYYFSKPISPEEFTELFNKKIGVQPLSENSSIMGASI